MTTVQKTWLKPNQLMQVIQKRKKLAKRLKQNNERPTICENARMSIFAEEQVSNKRRNPFAKAEEQEPAKKQKEDTSIVCNIEEDSVLSFVYEMSPDYSEEAALIRKPGPISLRRFDKETFSKILVETESSSEKSVQREDEVDLPTQTYTQHLPVDWALKSRVRLFCPTQLPTTMLKTIQMANSLTNFVRCVDSKSEASSMDISPATRFHQATYYWQHPHVPWMTLFPRNSKDNNGVIIGEREKNALMYEWDLSFRGLFQLLRAKQCSYFYFCANNFTVLFRAGGIAGNPEVHALITPTTSGLRQALRKDGIEFTMPLKGSKASKLNKKPDDSASDVDSSDEEQWLESLGVDKTEIRLLQKTTARKIKAAETADDFSDISLVLVEGVECHGLFNFLLNAKHSINSSGRLAGVPPTLLAPVAFPRATLEQVLPRSRTVRHEGVDYFSIEMSGIILPTFLPTILNLLAETKNTFSAHLLSHNNTLAFSKATQKLIECAPKNQSISSDTNDENGDNSGEAAFTSNDVFLRENLSGCGLAQDITNALCRTCPNAASLLQQVCYKKEHGYAWS